MLLFSVYGKVKNGSKNVAEKIVTSIHIKISSSRLKYNWNKVNKVVMHISKVTKFVKVKNHFQVLWKS